MNETPRRCGLKALARKYEIIHKADHATENELDISLPEMDTTEWSQSMTPTKGRFLQSLNSPDLFGNGSDSFVIHNKGHGKKKYSKDTLSTSDHSSDQMKRRTSPPNQNQSESTRTRDSYENEKLKERIKILENDQKQQNKENQILNLENKRLREENKRIMDKHKYEKTVWEEELKQALVIALQSIQNRGPQIDLLTDSTQVEKNIIQLFRQQNQV